jgi:hypothetical protein
MQDAALTQSHHSNEPPQGYALTCCSHPQSDVTVKCIPEDELIDEQFSR